MRRIIGLVLMGLAGFLVTTALLALFYIPGAVKKTPLNTDTYTRLDGTASTLPNGTSGPVKYFSHSVTDGAKSDGDVAVFDDFVCLISNPNGDAPDCVDDTDPEKRLVQASTDRFATDRNTGMAVDAKDEAKYGVETHHEGLINKFPFGAEKKTYPFWDGVLDRAVDATFEGEDTIDGVKVYKYVIDVQDEPAEISTGIQGTYSSLKTIWADPVTGQMVDREEQQTRKLQDGKAVLDLDISFTDETVAANVKNVESNVNRLSLVGRLPLIAGILGLLSGLVGFFLWNGARRANGGYAAGPGRDDDGGTPAYASERSLDVFGDADADTNVSRADIHRR
ncbi:DUF3068 domain-containing protein [Knoellia sinensis]|nr:DUF3068 domain-containing protein [Knoellia sinensis]